MPLIEAVEGPHKTVSAGDTAFQVGLPGQRPDPESKQRLPSGIGRYKVRGRLGQGGMGQVYEAWDPWLRREVAVKTLKEPLAKDARTVQRFRREAEALARFSHPALVSVYDVGEGFIVLELLAGETLAARLKRERLLQPPEALRILKDLGDALDHIHAGGVVHRDLKPHNVMILPDGRAKLMDFSVAHVSWAPMTRTGELIGAPAYFAPEQIARGRVSPASDRYALGAVAFEMLTGQRPFVETSLGSMLESIVLDSAPPASSINNSLPATVDAVLARVLDKDPQRRHASARELVEALTEAFSRSRRRASQGRSLWSW
jgi:serine/threonine-protein kinase